MSPELKQHLLDFAKGLLAAIVTSVCLTFVNYIGAHIGDLTSFGVTAATATAAVKLSH